MTIQTANRPFLRRLLLPALFLLTLLLIIGRASTAEAALYRTWIAQAPSGNPTSAQSVRIWMDSDTAFGETAGVWYRIGGTNIKVLGTYDSGGYAGANWRADIPAQPNGTFVEYQLFTRNEFGNDYGFTGFNWNYTVNDGDVQWSGLKHDTFDSYYRSPFGAVPAGTQVTLRFRTVPLDATGVDVRVYTYDAATQSTTGPVDYAMTYLEDADGGAIWTRTLTTPSGPSILYYHFKVTDQLDVDWYSDDHGGPHDNLNQGGTGAASDNQGAEGFQLTVYDPSFVTPLWLQNGNVYQIFPDRFRNGDPLRDYCQPGTEELGCPVFYGDQEVIFRSPWNTEIGNPRVAGPYFNEYGTQFYGGDLAGLMEKLDYLQAAGFDVIYTTPIFDGSSNHRYDTDDYLSVDPGLGSLSDFQALITAMDARGMKLIVDGVFNHTSSDSVYFDRYHRYPEDGACESLTSQYRSWFEFANTDIPCGDGDYTGWFGYSSLAVLQDGNADVRDFIYRYTNNSVVETWYERGVHGWRFDVADEISHDWWRDFRPYAKSYKADGPLVGEVWPDASNFLLGDQLDSVMNYRFRKNVLGFVRQADFTDNDNNGTNEIISLSPSEFDRALRSVREDYPPPATAAMLNLLDSHDTNRLRYLVDILGETDAQTLERQKLAALFQYTYVGAPMVYYGDEVAIDSPSLANGVNGPEDDPYNRAPYPWADEGGDTNVYGPADGDMLAFYSLLGSLRRNSDALRNGSFYTVLTGDTSPDPNDNTTYAFTRILLASEAVVAINPGTASNTAVLPIEAEPGRVLEDKLTGTEYIVDSNGAVTVTLPPRTGVLLMDPTPTSLTVKKVVVGMPPAADWQFGGDQGSFTLPPAGGQTTFSPLPAGSQIIAETDEGGWVPAVACAPGGETGTTFVEVVLDDGEQATCTFTNTQCLPGTYDTGGASCVEANPGYYVDVAGATSQTECSPGTYQSNYAGVQCDLADPGYYAGGTAAPSQTACAPGSYQPNSGQESCLLTDPGYFVNIEAAQMQSECALGSYQPNSGQQSCLLADPGYYVDSTAAIEQTACPSGTTSPQGSDSIDDCVATTATLTIVKATDPAGGTGFPFTLDPGAISYVDQWGVNGVGQGQFNGPFGIATDDAGNVYVADTFAYRVQKFDADGNFILMWGKDVKSGAPTGYEICLAADSCKAGVSGSGNGEFNIPHGIAVDPAGNVYVADKDNHRIQKFDASGNYLGQWGTNGSSNGQFNRPSGVAADDAGNVYVADTGNNRVQKFAAAGGYLGQWGGLGSGNSQFNNPYGVAVYGDRVYVADTFNDRIQVFDADGNYLNKWGATGGGDSQFEHPYGIAVDAAGNVYVADSFINASPNNRIQKFDAGGGYLGQWGSAGSGDGQFDMPTGVAVARGGDIYVVENEGHRVQRFSQGTVTLDDGQSHAYSNLAPGTYLVSELVPENWALSNIDCGNVNVVANGNGVSVPLTVGDEVTCTFTNIDATPPTTGRIDIVKEATPADDTPFDFTENIMNFGFTLTDPDSNVISFEGVTPGTYTVTEGDTAGWTLDNIDCDDTNSTESVATKTATINLAAGETVICTFTNIANAPDTTPPDTTIDTAPASVTNNNDPSFTFSSTEPGSTFECKLGSGPWEACSSPKSYTDVADGEHTFYVRATDAANNTDPTPASHTWTIDTIAPNTTIDVGPPPLTNLNDPSFFYGSNKPGSTFECKLDDGAWETCGPMKGYTDVPDGEHTFYVRATDAAGNTDPTPDSQTWTIDTAAPTVTITSAPPDPSSSVDATFEFTSETGATFECQLDNGGWSSCGSPKNYSGLSEGEHTFEVRATDAAGNTGDPASHTWTIDTSVPDTTPPQTTIDSAPPALTNNNDPSFTFSSSETGSTFECKLDDGAWGPCSSPKSYTDVTDGEHTFYVRATDGSNNTDQSPASHTWTIDTAAPDTTILTMPPDPTNDRNPSFTFSSSETGSTFECKLGADDWEPCSSPKNYTNIPDSDHTFQVRATDAAGNTDPTPASYHWLIDIIPPYVTITSGPPDPSDRNDADFEFTSEPGATFECRNDGDTWSPCTSPIGFAPYIDGPHTFEVRATDAAGNTGDPASWTWTVDTGAPTTGAIFVSANAAGSVAGGPSFGSEDILKWDGSAWSVWFDGSAAGLDPRKAKHNINAISVTDEDAGTFIFSFTQNRRTVPGIVAPVDGMDLLSWNGSSFSVYFDGSDVGLTNKTQEKIDALHVLDGSESPIGSGCLAYLLISTQGPGKVPNHSGGNLKFGGEDVLGFCATSLGPATTGLWHLVVDGSAEGAPRNAIDSLSASDDGQTLYLTTQGAFNVDSAAGGHSVVYKYEMATGQFSGPYFSAPAEGLTVKVDALDVAGDLP